jgi:hypothetical protein
MLGVTGMPLMLRVIILNVVIQSVIILNVVTLRVAALSKACSFSRIRWHKLKNDTA